MSSFALPEFYVPWPARLNPHLEAARIHSKAWAQEMGILDQDSIWSEEAFDRHDYALFCAYIHPETTSPELNLMTDWNVWAFYVDDYFLRVYKQKNDKAGAKAYLDRVLLFMPVDLGPTPAPASPTEIGLADLWMRTATSKSRSWRKRIIESTRMLLEASAEELQQRLANPIEYIDMRRKVGGALWSADLVEHACFVEVPERIAHTRPMQVLKNTFADAVHLRNDIFSYEREVLKEHELTNGVLVIERFLEVDTQRAVDIVNDLLTSRLQQFEHTVFTELIAMFQEYTLDPLEQVGVLTYIRGLQDWQSGAHEWHIQTSRYLNPGLGQTASANDITLPGMPGMPAMSISAGTLKLSMNRFKNFRHIPYKKVGPTQLPSFYMPYSTKLNPHLETARKHSKAWAYKMGVFDSVPGNSDLFIWDEKRFDAADVAFFCALAYPDATATEMDLAAYWLVWATYSDDFFPTVYGHTHNILGARIALARLPAFMPIELPSPTPEPITTVERALADLWAITAAPLSLAMRRVFRKIIEKLIESWATWELSNRVQNRIPDPIDYIEMRRQTGGVDFMLMFIRTVQGQNMPSEVYRTRTMQELTNTAADHICLINDLVSYQKEMEVEGEMQNAVLVIENFMDCDKAEAVEIVNKLMTARLKQFQEIVKTDLPILFENFNLNTQERDQILSEVKSLQNFMYAGIVWHTNVDRYREVDFNRSPEPKVFENHSATHSWGKAGSQINNNIIRQINPAAPKAKKHASSHLSSPFLPQK